MAAHLQLSAVLADGLPRGYHTQILPEKDNLIYSTPCVAMNLIDFDSSSMLSMRAGLPHTDIHRCN